MLNFINLSHNKCNFTTFYGVMVIIYLLYVMLNGHYRNFKKANIQRGSSYILWCSLFNQEVSEDNGVGIAHGNIYVF